MDFFITSRSKNSNETPLFLNLVKLLRNFAKEKQRAFNALHLPINQKL
jgi:hypothetical protein